MKVFIAVLSIAIVLIIIVSIQETTANTGEAETTFAVPNKKFTREDCKKECARRFTNGVLSKVIIAKLTGTKCYCKYKT
uniref:Scoloptoxin SSD996 n=1 Tax=Scolopendra dehaani TaxID=2609776 RepID=PNX36_SCODE|nr:RecName: Full=Scoloptoxin SSD996; Flags: Precursor [Scolopendra dehaani]